MKKRLKSLGIPALVMCALAVVLLGGGVVGSTRAAVNYYSQQYKSEVDVPSIGVTLRENGDPVGYRNYDKDAAETADEKASAENYNDESYAGWITKNGNDELLLWVTTDFTEEAESNEPVTLTAIDGNKAFEIGVPIEEKLTVENSGTIETYVRAIVYRYWTDSEGNRVQALDPKYIELTFNTEADWWIDEEASTAERTVLYYKTPLAAGNTTPEFLEKVVINPKVKSAKETVGTTTYAYSGMKFNLEAAVEAVQAENGVDAIKSAWGIDATSWATN